MLKKQFLGAKIQIFEIRCWLRSHIFFWVRIPLGEIFGIFPTLVLEKKFELLIYLLSAVFFS